MYSNKRGLEVNYNYEALEDWKRKLHEPVYVDQAFMNCAETILGIIWKKRA